MVDWTGWKRFWFRFIFGYFIIYILPFPLESIPRLQVVVERYADFWNRVVPWMGRHVLHLRREITELPGGSGDTTFNYVQLLCFAVIAFAIGVIWSVIEYRLGSRKLSSLPISLEERCGA